MTKTPLPYTYEAYANGEYNEAELPAEVAAALKNQVKLQAAIERQREALGEEAVAKHDAWVRQKVQEALDSAQYISSEEMEAKAAVWRERARRKIAAEARRTADEVGLGQRGRG